MGTTNIPTWLAVFLAVLAPLSAFWSAWFAQRATDRRALQEADLRLQHQWQSERSDRRYQAYQELILNSEELLRFYTAPGRYVNPSSQRSPKDKQAVSVQWRTYQRSLLLSSVIVPTLVREKSREVLSQAMKLETVLSAAKELVDIHAETECLSLAVLDLRKEIRTEMLGESGGEDWDVMMTF